MFVSVFIQTINVMKANAWYTAVEVNERWACVLHVWAVGLLFVFLFLHFARKLAPCRMGTAPIMWIRMAELSCGRNSLISLTSLKPLSSL